MVVEREENRSPKQPSLTWENCGNGCGLKKYLFCLEGWQGEQTNF